MSTTSSSWRMPSILCRRPLDPVQVGMSPWQREVWVKGMARNVRQRCKFCSVQADLLNNYDYLLKVVPLTPIKVPTTRSLTVAFSKLDRRFAGALSGTVSGVCFK